MTKAQRSLKKKLQKNLQQFIHKQNTFPRLENRTVQQATIQDAKEEFATGFADLASLYSAEELEQSTAKKAIDKVTAAIHKSSMVTVSRTHTGGSLGRRTLVKDAFDVDLIVYVKKYNGQDMTDPDKWRYDTDLVTAMRQHVKERLEAADLLGAWDVQIPQNAHYCDVLQVVVNGVPVDLLLVPDCVRGKPSDPAWEQHIALMKEVYDSCGAGAEYDMIRERADAAALTSFVSTVHDDVKTVVRFVKALYKFGVLADTDSRSGGGSWWPPEDDRIRSVSLEVLVLAADQRLRTRAYGGGRKASGNVYKLELFQEFLELVVAAVRRKEVVSVAAGPWGYQGEVRDFERCWAGDAIRIIHPIDPTCNLERPREHRGPANWQPLLQLAEALLKLLDGGGSFKAFCAVPAVARAMQDIDKSTLPVYIAAMMLDPGMGL
ncbi:hypothetical protein HYH02_003350 [Chlamydomonas schloesseri]|uniref:Nucleotidyltransferase n=1 Tax=Chlamydomonas schloesseri TaxID=2026947 RepID=A0A835WT60_9CHLO|nr:hypothetical protein HYH02_003350 [Chlamydomonas schloesseri]|eukprot:KAG2452326.1 hypothetical protein HYH02_003350 [Chlamydomonas schloesseri]